MVRRGSRVRAPERASRDLQAFEGTARVREARAADPERCSHSRGRAGRERVSARIWAAGARIHRTTPSKEGLHSRLRFEKIDAARRSRRRAGRMPALHEREGS